MKKLSWFALLFLTACSRPEIHFQSEQDATPIIAAERAFAARHQQVSVKQAFLEFSAPDGVAVEEKGVRNIHESLMAAPDRNNAGFIEWWPTFAGISKSGDLGFTTGPGIFGKGKFYSSFVTVWKRQPDGTWKWLIDLGTNEGVKPTGLPSDQVEQLSVSNANTKDAQNAWKELRAIDQKLGQQSARDTHALLDWITPQSRLLGRTAAPAEGRSAIQAVLSAGPASVATTTEGGGVSAAGDLGWTYGYAAWKDGQVDRRGPYVRVWQRLPHGWTLVIDDTYSF